MSQAGEGNRVYGLLKVRESCLYACVEAGARLLHGVLQANECCCSVRTTHLLPPTHVGQRGILLRAGASARVPIRPRSFVWVEGAARPSIGPSLASSSASRSPRRPTRCWVFMVIRSSRLKDCFSLTILQGAVLTRRGVCLLSMTHAPRSCLAPVLQAEGKALFLRCADPFVIARE